MSKFISNIFISLLILIIFSAAASGANTPNKNYNNQTTGSNTNTWGVVLNSNFTTIDNNLGGTLTLSVAGNSNVTLSLAQSQNLIYNFTGVLTGNINVIFPAAGGLYFINNQTTGAYTLTIEAGTSTAGFVVPQGQSAPIVVDNSTSPPTIDGATGTQYVYSGITVGGTANAITVSLTSPTNFTLNNGTLLLFTPTNTNTSSVTLTTPDGSTKALDKVTLAGIVPVQLGDLDAGIPIIAIYNGTEWLDVTVPFQNYETTVSGATGVGLGQGFINYVNTAAVTYTIDETTNLIPWWYIGINAMGGAATITPNAADVINVNGAALSAGTSFTVPQGASAQITTDANGNLFINFLGNRLNVQSTIASATTTDLGSEASNIVSITGTTTITSFGSSASASNPLYFITFTGALTLTNNATSLILPGGANITTAAGDSATALYLGSGDWQVLSYNTATPGVTAGSYTTANITVNALGQVTAASSGTSGITLLSVRSPTGAQTDTQSSIPSTAKKITVSFNGLVPSGSTGNMGMRIGPSGGVATSGYLNQTTRLQNNTAVASSASTGSIDFNFSWGSAVYGTITLNLMDATNNIWTWQGIVYSGSYQTIQSGTVALSGALSQIEMLQNGGTPANFSSGSWQVSYE